MSNNQKQTTSLILMATSFLIWTNSRLSATFTTQSSIKRWAQWTTIDLCMVPLIAPTCPQVITLISLENKWCPLHPKEWTKFICLIVLLQQTMLHSALHSSITPWNTRETTKAWLLWDCLALTTENPFQLSRARTQSSARDSQLSTGQLLLSQRWSTPTLRTRLLTRRRKIDAFKRQPRWFKTKELTTKMSVQSLCSQSLLTKINKQHLLTTKSLDN